MASNYSVQNVHNALIEIYETHDGPTSQTRSTWPYSDTRRCLRGSSSSRREHGLLAMTLNISRVVEVNKVDTMEWS